jgi:hypothetical protein
MHNSFDVAQARQYQDAIKVARHVPQITAAHNLN